MTGFISPSGTAITRGNRATGPFRPWAFFIAMIRGGLDLAVAWQQRGRERRHLASLDERMLRDLGVSRSDATRESAKPFWRA